MIKELIELESINDAYNVELEQFKEMDPDLFDQKSTIAMVKQCYTL